MINRGALIIRPKKPYLDWAASLDDSGLLPNVEGEQTVYLIPNWDTDKDAEVIIEQVFADLFENALLAWHTDESAWPANRDLKTFREWFSIEFHSIVEDLCDYELFDEDEESE